MAFVLNRLYLTAFHKVSGPVYLGIGFHNDEFGNIEDERAEGGESTPFTEYSGDSCRRRVPSAFP